VQQGEKAMSESEKGYRLEQKGSELKLVDFQVCPSCGKADGYVGIGRSRWGYCKTHKTKWMAGIDLLNRSDEVTEEQDRVYDELGLGKFTLVYREELERQGRSAREELERQKRSAATGRVMPVFAFLRRRDIELEVGLILARKLVVDIPKTTRPKRRHQRLIAEIVERLTEGARTMQMPDDAVVYGWPGNQRPANAADVDNDELMANWAKTRIVIEVRVDPRNDGVVRIDSDALRQMGIIKEH